MAGRPVNEAQREKRRQEVDAAIAVIKRRKQPVTKKAIADEMGLSIQSFYVAGFLRQYAEELENSGVIVKERGRSSALSAEEEKALRRENTKLKKENEVFKQKITKLKKIVAAEKAKNADLTEQLEIERGNTFMKKKAEFASRHI